MRLVVISGAMPSNWLDVDQTNILKCERLRFGSRSFMHGVI